MEALIQASSSPMTSWTVAEPARNALQRVREHFELNGRDKVAPWMDEVIGAAAAKKAPPPTSYSSSYSPPPPYTLPTFPGYPSFGDDAKAPFASSTSSSGPLSFGSPASSYDDPFGSSVSGSSSVSSPFAVPPMPTFGGSGLTSNYYLGAPSVYGGDEMYDGDFLGRSSTAMYWCARSLLASTRPGRMRAELDARLDRHASL